MWVHKQDVPLAERNSRFPNPESVDETVASQGLSIGIEGAAGLILAIGQLHFLMQRKNGWL